MNNLIFFTKQGFTNIYVKNNKNIELGFIISDKFSTVSGHHISPNEMYEISNKITGNPSYQEMRTAHSDILERNRKLRLRVTELTEELNKYKKKYK